MSMMKTRPGSIPGAIGADDLTGTARTRAAVCRIFRHGVLGFLLVRGQPYVTDDPGGTLSNLVEHTSMAGLGIVLELGIVLTQALAAVWFYRLFRSVDSFAARLVAVFGMVNAVAILCSAAVLATALDVSDDKSLAVSGGVAATVQVLYVISGHLWGVGGLFFGLWLIPMGWLVVRSRGCRARWARFSWSAAWATCSEPSSATCSRMPISWPGLLIVPAIIGELWIAGYLILVGVRNHARPDRQSAT